MAQAGDLARGATAYVTLEPCAHHGRTSPCAEALVAAGVGRVVSAMVDPDPRVAGKGHAILRDAGIEVCEGIAAEAAASMQAGFLSRIMHARPVITLKLASSFDGRIATSSGESKWITGETARRHVHVLRAMHDAIMVGGKTARADRPSLNVRGLEVPRQPARVVVTRQDLPDLPAESADFGPLWKVSGPVHGIIDDLAARGVTRVFCEGGGQLAAELLNADLVDELVGYTAGVALGGEGRASLGPLEYGRLAEAPRFRLVETRQLGGDLFHRWRRYRS